MTFRTVKSLKDAESVQFGDQYTIDIPADPQAAISPETVEFVEKVEAIIDAAVRSAVSSPTSVVVDIGQDGDGFVVGFRNVTNESVKVRIVREPGRDATRTIEPGSEAGHYKAGTGGTISVLLDGTELAEDTKK